MRPRLFDYLLILLSLSIIGIFSYNAYGKAQVPTEVIISSPERKWIYPLDIDGTFSVPGSLGPLEIEIQNREVRVLTSPCREKICIQTGSISRTGAWIACVPSLIFLEIEGREDDETDTDSF